jgi:hypothetical protein
MHPLSRSVVCRMHTARRSGSPTRNSGYTRPSAISTCGAKVLSFSVSALGRNCDRCSWRSSIKRRPLFRSSERKRWGSSAVVLFFPSRSLRAYDLYGL